MNEVRRFLRSGHVEPADVIRELNAVLQDHFFCPAAGEVERDFCRRFVLERLSAPRVGPPAHATEKMQLVGSETGLHFDALRIGPGEAGAAFQHDQVVASRTPGGTDNVEGHLADFDRAELSEPQRLVLGLFAVEQAARSVGGKGGREIQDAEPGFVRANVGQQIAQSFGSERFETLGHQRTAGRTPTLDVVLADREIAGRVAQQHLDVVLALDDAVVGCAPATRRRRARPSR